MPSLSKYVGYLSQEIGPRPAGTEEEQKAAFFIEERMKKATGLPTQIEEFEGANGNDLTRLICAGISLIAALLFMITAALAIPALILSILATALFVADYMGKPVIGRFYKKGISQNVVSKYVPETTQTKGRKRKIIVVTRYDSGKVRPELNDPFVKFLGLANRISAGSILFLLVWMLFRSIFFMYPEGGVAVFLNIVTVLAMIACALPLVLKALQQNAAYNDGANGSASGVAVMVEVAKRVARGQYDEAFDYEPTVHGEDAAYAEDVVPEGTELVYETEQTEPAPEDEDGTDEAFSMDMPTQEFAPISMDELFQPQDEPDSKPAAASVVEAGVVEPAEEEIAGEPVVEIEAVEPETEIEPEPEAELEPEAEPEPVEKPAPAVPAPAAVAAMAAATVATAAAPVMSKISQAEEHVPAWFASAQAKAKKSVANVPVSSYRSKYASSWEAIDEMTPEQPSFDAYEPVMQQPASSVQPEVVEEELVAQPVVETSTDPVEYAQAAPTAYEPEPEVEVAPEPVKEKNTEGERLVAIYKAAVVAPRAVAAPAQQQLTEVPVEESVQQPVAEAVEEVVEVAVEEQIDEPLVDVSEVLAQGVESLPAEFSEPAMPAFLRDEEEGEPAPCAVLENVPDFIGLPEIDVTPSTGRRAVVLPDITASNLAPIENLQQRAPLAAGEQAEDTSVAAKGLLNMLPAIDLTGANNPVKRPSLTLPSLSGAMSPVEVEETAPAAPAGSAGMTGSFAPVGDDLAEQVEDIEDLYIDDADDSDFDENFTESGAYAGPDYVEMPKSRFGGFFGKLFGGKKKAARPAAHERYADEDFDDSFEGGEFDSWDEYDEEPVREKERTVKFDSVDDNWDEWEDDRKWEGGAFSSFKDKVAGAAGAASGAVGNVAGALGSVKDRLPFGGSKEEPHESERHANRHHQHDAQQEGHSEHIHAPYVDPYASLGLNLPLESEESVPEAEQTDEQRMVEDFQNPPIKTEVWFVALGADMDGNAGMKAFMDEHAAELRGAMIIEIEAVGSGDLCLVGEEGTLKPAKASSRMKRFIRKANRALGINVPTVKLDWNDSASSYAVTHGCQALHLVGMDGNAPALLGKADDIAENVEEEALEITADYLMEVLRAV